MRFTSALFAIVISITLSPFAYARHAHGGHSGHTSSYSHSKPPTFQAGKTMYVKGYHKKNGTYVQAYNRHPKRTAPRSKARH